MTEKEIKNRLRSVNDTVKITRAMQMLATSKSYRAQNAESSAKSYFLSMDSAITDLLASTKSTSPLFSEGSGQSILIAVSGDKGLCGNYNDLILSKTEEEIAKCDVSPKIYSLGFVAREYYRGKGIHSDNSFVHIMGEPQVRDAERLAEVLLERYTKDDIKEVRIVYTAHSTSNDNVISERLLPYEKPNADVDAGQDKIDILGAVDIEALIKQHLTARLYYIITTASNAVNYKRMTAMQEATDNGEKMVEDLTKTYNRARQNKITNELNDAAAVLFGNKDE